jgi:hypothetical protein
MLDLQGVAARFLCELAGRLVVIYYDFRNDNSSGEPTDYWAVLCDPAASECAHPASWGDEVRLTDTSFDILNAPAERGHFLGDYMGLAAAADDILSVFGIAEGANQTTIFTRRINNLPAPVSAVPQP